MTQFSSYPGSVDAKRMPTKSAMETALRFMRASAEHCDSHARFVSGEGEAAEIYSDAAKCIAFAASQCGDPAQRPAKPDSLKTFSKIKALALNTKPEDVRDALAHIVRLCIDAGSRPPFDRNWTEDASHENGNYECLCCECGQVFIGHKRRVLCKACSGLLTSALPSTQCAVSVCTCRPGPCAFPSTESGSGK